MLVPLFRTMILYLLIIAAIRFMGKRQVGEMQPSELVVTILVSAVASVPMQDISISLAHGVVPILALIAMEVVLSAFSLKWSGLRRVLTGNPVTIITNGELDQDALKRLRLSIDDVFEDLRLNGVFDLRQVHYAQVETNGQISVMLNTLDSPATARMLGLSPIADDPFHVLIADGCFSEKALASLGKSRAWLDRVVAANGAQSDADVFLLCANARGGIIFEKKQRG